MAEAEREAVGDPDNPIVVDVEAAHSGVADNGSIISEEEKEAAPSAPL